MDNFLENELKQKPRELHGKKLVGFSMTALGQVMPNAIFSGYVYFYYVYVVGLDALLVSTGLFIALLFNAILSPIFGVISDNQRPTKFGKRKIFLLIGAPFQLLFGILVWTPPMCDPSQPFNWVTAIYFWIMAIGLNISLVCIGSPYAAMLPEQSQTEQNRVHIAAYQGIFNILGTIIGVVLPLIIQSILPDAQHTLWNTPSGAILTQFLPFIGALFGILCCIFILVTFFTVDESFLIHNSTTLIEKATIRSVFSQMMEPFKHRNARKFFWLTLTQYMAVRLIMTVILPIVNLVLILEGNQFILFIVVLTPIAFGGFVYWNKTLAKRGVQKNYAISLLLLGIVCLFGLVFLIPMSTIPRMITGMIVIGIAIAGLVGGFLFMNPILGSLVDEGQRNAAEIGFKNPKNISGAYFGMWFFMINISSGVANMILGVIYTGGNENNPFLLVLSLPVAGLLFFITLFFVQRLKITTPIHQ